MSSNTVNIIGRDNGAGLSRDMDLLSSLFRGRGWRVLVNGRRNRGPGETTKRIAIRAIREWRGVGIAAGVLSPPWALNLHIEDIDHQYLRVARRNVLIPNQEYFREASQCHLHSMDGVLTKTRLAQEIFSAKGCNARYVGWRGADRRIATSSSSDAMALHVAGRSQLKGTDAVLDAWERHPEWPPIVVVRQRMGYDNVPLPWAPRTIPPNVRVIDERISDAALRELQNAIRIHVAPSEAEGFGHVLAEAMSVGALVITTDAAPMNELITNAHGILVGIASTEPMNFGHLAKVDKTDLDRKIGHALNLSKAERDALGDEARTRFENNETTFEPRFWAAIESICI
jgi:glycosyltransferase involved in cell wall biosynthesis